MAVIGTFGSFTAARLGIYASQASLNVTGNNIANINTVGYTRQRMDLVSLYSYGTVRYANSFHKNIGYGVLTNSVSQLRDPFLDIRYREENAKMGAYDEKLDCLQQLAQILDEVGKGNNDFGIIEAQFSDFLQQLQNLSGKVGSVEYDTTARGSAQTLTRLFNDYSKAMETLAANKLNELKEDVKTVNSLLTQIRDLSVQIRDAGIVGDQALELRDARNLCIDQLSAYMKINVTYDEEKIDEFNSVERINISIADSGTPPIMLIRGIYGAQISMPEYAAARNPNYNPDKVTDADRNEFISKVTVGSDGKIKIEYTNNPLEAMKDADGGLVRNDSSDETLNALLQRLATLRQKQLDAAEAKKEELTASQSKLNDEKAALEEERAGLDATDDADRIAAIDERLAEIQDELDEIQDKLDGIDTDAIEDQFDALEAELTAAQGGAGWTAENDFFDPETANAPYIMYQVDGEGNPVLDADGNMIIVGYTWDADGATKVPNALEETPTENRLWMIVEPLVDAKGRYMRDENHKEIKTSVDLTDNQLYGSLQSLREFLTERGEFSSSEDLQFDEFATQKRGIQYYQNALDALAKKFAEAFNKANQLDFDKVSEAYQTILEDPDDPNSAYFVDKNGNKIEGIEDDEGNAGPAFFDTLAKRMAELEALQKQVASGKYSAEELKQMKDDKATLEQELEDLKAAASEPPTDEEQAEIDAKQEEIDALQAKIDSGKLTPDEIAAKKAQIDGLKEYVDKYTPIAYEAMETLRNEGLLTEKWSFYNGGVLFSNNGDTNDPTGITAGNITISAGWESHDVQILNTKKADGIEHSTANDNIYHMIELMSEDMNYFPNEVDGIFAASGDRKYFTGSFQERLADMNSILAVETNTTALLYNEYTATTLNLENSRQSVAGVDLNDEATNMMVFQKAYAAACQLMTTLDSMLDKLINGTLR